MGGNLLSEDERLTVSAAEGGAQAFGWCEASGLLGISEWTTRRLIDSGDLPAYRPSRRTLWVRQEDLEEYLEARKTTENVKEE